MREALPVPVPVQVPEYGVPLRKLSRLTRSSTRARAPNVRARAQVTQVAPLQNARCTPKGTSVLGSMDCVMLVERGMDGAALCDALMEAGAELDAEEESEGE